MARLDMGDTEYASVGEAKPSGEDFFDLGMQQSAGLNAETDLIAAHKWFNLAAISGMTEATYYRQQVAQEMSDEDVAAAQRAAREWITTH